MPYIKEDMRDDIREDPSIIESAGELNFYISDLLKNVVEDWGESYATYNEIIGVLECVKLELYRRKITPYEDKKIEENGDVY